MIVKQIFNNQYVRYMTAFALGLAVCYFLLPSKSKEETVKSKYEEMLSTQKQEYEESYSQMQSVLEEKEGSSKEYREFTEKTISELTTKVHTLQSKQKTSWFKLVKPDGTIEERQFSESEVNETSSVVTEIQEEFKQKIESIESKWKTIHEQRVTELQRKYENRETAHLSRIAELESKTVTKTNEKKFGAETGLNTDKNLYLHGTADILGPFFIGAHGETDKDFGDKSIGVGVGVKF